MYSFPTKEVLTEAARVAHVSLIFHNKSLHLISQPNKISFSLNVRCLSPVCRSNGAKSLKISSYLRLHRQKRRKFCEQISPSKAVFISCSGALQRVQVKNFALSIRACKGLETYHVELTVERQLGIFQYFLLETSIFQRHFSSFLLS